jgi:hypothetical protein
LPIRWHRWREPERTVDLDLIARPLTQDVAMYWKRSARALACLSAGVLAPADLPSDMDWEPATIAVAQSLTTLATYDELLIAIEGIVPDITRAQIRAMLAEREEEPASGAGAPGEAEKSASESSGSGASGSASSGKPGEPGSSAGADASKGESAPGSDPSAGPDNASQTDGARSRPGTENPPESPTASNSSDARDEESEDPSALTAGDAGAAADAQDGADARAEETASKPPPAPFDPASLPEEFLDAIDRIIREIGDDPFVIDFFTGDPAAAPSTGDHERPIKDWKAVGTPRSYVPTWSALSRSAADVREPLRRVFLELEENADDGWERRQRQGRLDLMRVARENPGTRVFRKRQPFDEFDDAFGLILDRSGSMGCSIGESVAPEAFGTGSAQRWHLSAQLGVAFAEAIERLPASRLAITIYSSCVELVKSHNARLTIEQRDEIIRKCVATGDNEDAEAIRTTVADLARSSAKRRFIFHLTDGQFCSSEAEMRDALAFARQHRVEIVFLTLDVDPDYARRYVPDHLAERVDRNTLIPTVRRHLRRMVQAA